ncbi:hypothetical protein Leryth_019503 [Lithospermum erythrorhizon]|nr:hypothetical protein Leryth_019503 [Lithospermum erythrorhizon]
MGRSPCCEKSHTNKGAWTKEEDERLINYIRTHGEGCWRSLPKAAGLLRCGKSCRLRWINYLRPDLKRGNFTEEEDDIIIKLHGLLGNKWSLIAGRLPGRTDNEIKNYWNTHIKRKLISRGIDPQTHRLLNGATTTTTTNHDITTTSTTTDICLDYSSTSPPLNDKTNLMIMSQALDTKFKLIPSIIETTIEDNNTKCSSVTTEETLIVPSQPQNKPSINLELSIGLPSHDDDQPIHKTNINVFATTSTSSSSPDSAESRKFSCDFLKVETPSCNATTASASNIVAQGVCSCWQLGFNGTNQLCNSCQGSKRLYRYWLQ